MNKYPNSRRFSSRDRLGYECLYNRKHIASWVGMCQGNNESAGKKSGHTTHGNKQLRSTLTEVAWAATRTKDTFYNARYHKLVARRGKKIALIAIEYSILKSVYHMLAIWSI